MANKKISELSSRTPSLTDLMLVGDPSSGYSYKCTVNDIALQVEVAVAGNYVTLATTQTISGAKTFSNVLTLTSVANSSVDTDKFLVLTGTNTVNYRTGTQVLSDIGAQGILTLTTTGTSGAATLVGNTLNIPNYAPDLSGYVPTSRTLTINGTAYDLSANRTWSVGTVTNVGLSAPTGFSVTGSPITSSGTLALAFASGYSLPTTASQGNWDSAYNNMIVSAEVTGTTTKTLTLTQQDASTITATWTDNNTDAVTSVFGRTGAVVATSGDYNTSQVTENTNLYYTDSRARLALSAGTGISYNNTTGAISSTITQYTDALARAAISLTTTGSSGSATYSSSTGVLNVPTYTLSGLGGQAQLNGTGFVKASGTTISYDNNTYYLASNPNSYIALTALSATAPLSYNNTTGAFSISQATTSTNGYLSSTDWNTFNNKQNALTNPVTGTGTTNYIPKFTGTSAIGNSIIQQGSGFNGIGINIAPSGSGLAVLGSANNTSIEIGNYSTSNGFIQSYDRSASTYKPFVLRGSQYSFSNGTSDFMTLDASGNLGLGVTPSAWSVFTAMQIGNTSYANYLNRAYIGANWYYGSGDKYIASDYATLYQQGDGSHKFYTAPSGTAGNAISFTQAMTLFSTGNLAVGGTSDDGYKLDVNGTGRFSRMIIGGTATSRILQVNTSGNDGIRILTSGDNPTLDMMQTAAANAGARNWRIVTNWEGWGTMDFQSGTNNTNDPSTTRLSISGTTGAATFSSSVTANRLISSYTATDPSLSSDAGSGLSLAGSVGVRLNMGALAGSPYNAWIQASNGSGTAYSIALNPLGGNVGIGTTAPNYLLEVNGNIGIMGQVRSFSGGYGLMHFNATGANNNYVVSQYVSAESKYLITTGYNGTGPNVALAFGTSDTERMRITSGGNVEIKNELLINTTVDAGDYKLQVNGNVYSTGDFTINKSSPNINLYAGTGTSAQYNINNSSGTLHWAMYSTIGGAGAQGNWQLYSAGKTGGAGNVIDITPAGAVEFSSSIKTGSSNPAWKLGAYGTAIGGSDGYAVAVEIGGTTYYLMTAYLP